MNNLNSIIVEGNLTAAPKMSYTPSGTPVASFTIGCNRFYRSDDERREEVSFIPIEVWSRLAESCTEYLCKGRGVRVVGRLKQDRWTTADGQSMSRLKVVGEHVEFRYGIKKVSDQQEET